MDTSNQQILLNAHSFKSTAAAVREVLAHVAGALRKAGHRPITVGGVELALAEVLNNVVEHSFLDRSNGDIELTVTLSDQRICICIRHDGTPMPGLCLPQGNPVNLAVDRADLPEGGFGWLLIRSLATKIEYSHRGESNQLNLCFPRCAAT